MKKIIQWLAKVFNANIEVVKKEIETVVVEKNVLSNDCEGDVTVDGNLTVKGSLTVTGGITCYAKGE